MSKDFNVYQWRREYLAKSVLKEEQDNSFAQGWVKDIEPKAGKTEDGKKYTHVISNAPAKQYERIEKAINDAGYKIVGDRDLPVDGRMSLYLVKK
jgi:hypothetical protein